MLARLTLRLEANKFDYKKSSALQGVLFENIDDEYADYLHQQQLHPYSQYVYKKNDNILWVINTLNNEAYSKIIKKLYSEEFNQFHLKKGNADVGILNKDVEELSKEELVKEFNTLSSDKTINIQLISPMAFKQRGNYIALPDIRLIYQSIMNKYSASSDKYEMIDEETLEQMVLSSAITKFNIRSVAFPLEGIRVPGAIGDIRIKIYGSDIMARYARLLFRFAEYSGVGVKTAMGMGAIRIREKGYE